MSLLRTENDSSTSVQVPVYWLPKDSNHEKNDSADNTNSCSAVTTNWRTRPGETIGAWTYELLLSWVNDESNRDGILLLTKAALSHPQTRHYRQNCLISCGDDYEILVVFNEASIPVHAYNRQAVPRVQMNVFMAEKVEEKFFMLDAGECLWDHVQSIQWQQARKRYLTPQKKRQQEPTMHLYLKPSVDFFLVFPQEVRTSINKKSVVRIYTKKTAAGCEVTHFRLEDCDTFDASVFEYPPLCSISGGQKQKRKAAAEASPERPKPKKKKAKVVKDEEERMNIDDVSSKESGTMSLPDQNGESLVYETEKDRNRSAQDGEPSSNASTEQDHDDSMLNNNNNNLLSTDKHPLSSHQGCSTTAEEPTATAANEASTSTSSVRSVAAAAAEQRQDAEMTDSDDLLPIKSRCYYFPFCRSRVEDCGGIAKGCCLQVSSGRVVLPPKKEFKTARKRAKKEAKKVRRAERKRAKKAAKKAAKQARREARVQKVKTETGAPNAVPSSSSFVEALVDGRASLTSASEVLSSSKKPRRSSLVESEQANDYAEPRFSTQSPSSEKVCNGDDDDNLPAESSESETAVAKGSKDCVEQEQTKSNHAPRERPSAAAAAAAALDSGDDFPSESNETQNVENDQTADVEMESKNEGNDKLKPCGKGSIKVADSDDSNYRKRSKQDLVISLFDRMAGRWDEVGIDYTTAIYTVLKQLPVLSFTGAHPFVVDFGCGSGVLTGLMRRDCAGILAIDASSKMIELVKKKKMEADWSNVDALNVVLAQMEEEEQVPDVLAEWEGKADLVVATRTMTYVPKENLAKTMKALGRLLKPGGIFCHVDPPTSSLQSYPKMSKTKAESLHAMADLETVSLNEIAIDLSDGTIKELVGVATKSPTI